ncbi:hypothetical protein EC988_000999 [Linderina pennispora]|nr:hypothetical protein EC988_000999 [Linderina pennispora]
MKPTKNRVFERIKPFVSGARGAAENVAFNQRSVDDVMKAWINSPGHHDNIVGPYDSVGFASIGLTVYMRNRDVQRRVAKEFSAQGSLIETKTEFANEKIPDRADENV